MAIRRIIRVVQIKDNSGRRFGVAGDEMIHKGPSEPIEILTWIWCSRRENVGALAKSWVGSGRPLS